MRTRETSSLSHHRVLNIRQCTDQELETATSPKNGPMNVMLWDQNAEEKKSCSEDVEE